MIEHRRASVVQSVGPLPSAAHELTALFWFASLLFLLSGASGLAYEVIWFKRFSHIWGNSTLAVAAVVGPFLFGLGVGAYTIGRLADRIAVPLVGYGWCEVGIGLLALVIPLELRGLDVLFAYSYPLLKDRLLLHSVVRCALALLVLGPPCVLMGGSLPLLVRQFSSTIAALDRSTAWLYAINTLGAAAGCYVTGFHLLPAIGLNWSNLLAVGVNLLVGASAIVAGRLADMETIAPMAPVGEEHAGPAAAPSPALPRLSLDAAVALSGCASLILQVVWARQLALILGGSTYAFSAMLFVILLGIAFGSGVSRRLLASGFDALGSAALLLGALVLSVALGQRTVESLTYGVALAGPVRGSQTLNALLSIAASAGMELLPSLAMGLLFPLFVSLAAGAASRAGRTVGEVYAWNTIGTMVGAFVTSTLLIPGQGTRNSITVALCAYTASVVLLLPRTASHRQRASWAALALAGWVIWLSQARGDPRITNYGMYIYGYKNRQAILNLPLVYFREGATSNVLVLREESGALSLRVNGKVDASESATDMPMQLGLAFYPRFLRPRARKVLVIGLGSGTTAGTSLLFPDTEVRCVELEPAVFAASSHFAQFNHSPERDPRFAITFDDGRSFLQGTVERFDLILSEPSHPWMAGVSNLFTREFYRAAIRRLSPDGIFVQWLQAYSATSADYTMIARTLMSVFPHYGMVRISEFDTLLLGSAAPIEPTAEALAQAQAMVDSIPAAKADLQKYFKTSDVLNLLVQNFILDEDGMRRLVAADGSQRINTDLDMRLEFDAPRHLYQVTGFNEVDQTYFAATDASHFARLFDRLNGSKSQVGVFHQLAVTLAANQRVDAARQIVELGLERDPQRPDLVGSRMALSPDADPEPRGEDVAAVLAGPESYANAIGVYLSQNKKYREAVAVLEGLTARHPSSPIAWKNLARAYAVSGQPDKARSAFEKAVALDPLDDAARAGYQAILNSSARAQAASTAPMLSGQSASGATAAPDARSRPSSEPRPAP